MNTSITSDQPSANFELRFRSLLDPGRGYSFPCDANGRVDMDSLSERARDNYFLALSVVGRDLDMPAVQQLARSVVGATADPHADQARRRVDEELGDLVAL